MKRILSSLSILALVIVTATGCLKDTGFEDNEYGINNPGGSKAGVGFNLGLSDKEVFGINAVNTAQTIDVIVNYTGPLSDKDITVTIAPKNILVTNYNDSNGTTTEIPAAGQLTIPTSVVIPAGQHYGTISIGVPDASVFDPTVEYGIGLQIVSADNGVQVAQNLDELFVAFNIKNKYDGRYTLKASLAGWAAYGISDGPTVYTLTGFNLVTSGPASVTFDHPQTGDSQFGWTTTGGLTSFGATGPQITFDPATDKVIKVENLVPDDGRGRIFILNPAVTTSAFDPATHNVFVSYILKQNGRPNMIITANFTYVGPR